MKNPSDGVSPWRRVGDARFKDALLDGEIFRALQEARIVIEEWRKHYTVRLHNALGYRPPAPEAVITFDQGLSMHQQ